MKKVFQSNFEFNSRDWGITNVLGGNHFSQFEIWPGQNDCICKAHTETRPTFCFTW